MFLRPTKTFKNGTVHDYSPMVANVRNWGEAWLGLELWDKLGLDGFWREVSDTPRHLWSIRAPFVRR